DIGRIDAVLFTHAHADHILGIDDLRRFNAATKSVLDIYGDRVTLDVLRQMFRYIFEPHTNVNQSFIAMLLAHEMQEGRGLDLFGATWTPLRLLHGKLPIIGYRIDCEGASIAYCTD